MTEWKTVTLSDLGEIIGGATPATSRDDYYNGDIPWLTPKDLAGYSGRYISRGERNITQDGLNSCSTRLLPKNTVLFSSRAPIGYIAIAANDICTNQGFKSIVPNAHVSPLFLYYLLKYYKHEIEAMGSGTTFKEVSGATMRRIKVRVPVLLDIQQRIADVLDALDAKIELNQKMNDNLQQQAIAIFNNALQQSKSISYVDLGTLGDVKGGKRLPKGINLITKPNSHPYIRVRDLNNVVFASLSAEYEYVDDETQKQISRYITSAGDVLISIVGTIGLTAIVDKSLDNANLTENCVKVTNLNGITPEYLLLYLRSATGVEAITKGTVGAVQLKLPIKNIQAIPVPILPKPEAEPLNEVLLAFFNQIAANVAESQRLSETRDALLPKLMSGELDVSSLDL